MNRLRLKFDSMTSHDITFVGGDPDGQGFGDGAVSAAPTC